MLDPFGYSPLRLAPGRDLYQPNLGFHGFLEPGGRPGAGRLNRSNGPTKLVHFITKRIFLMLDPFGYSPLRLAPGRDLYQPNLGPHGCSEPGGRPGAGRLNGSNGPTKLVHFITKRIFLMLDPFGYSPLRLAPGRDLYQPNLGPHGFSEPGGRPGAGRLNRSNGPTKLVHFITKRIFLMLDPFGYSPLRLAPGRDLYQPNLGPHGCSEPGGRPGAGRLNGSNGPTKLVHFITKRIFLMLDPFGYSPLRLAPGRDLYQPNLGPHGCSEPGGRPGAGRLNGSNGPTKLVHFITKRIFLMLDPFGYSPLRLAPGRDLYQPNQGPHGCSEPGGRPGAGRLNGSNGPTKLVHFITKRIFLMLAPFWIFAPTACPRTGPIPAQSRSPWVLGTRRSSWGRPSEWVKWTNEIGAFHHKTDILDVGPVWIFAPTACPRTGPIPAQSRSPWVLGTRRSSWGRPSEWVKWTNEIGAFHHKTDILDVGPVWIFAPTACPRTGPIPAQSRSPWVLGTRRSSWGRPSEWVKWTNEIGAFHHKTDILDVGPVWIFAPTACPRTGPIPAQSRSHGCLEPGGRPGAGRLNGSNGPTKLVHFITKRIFLMLDPFGYSPLRLAPGRDLYQPNLGPHGCLEPGGRPGAGRLNGSNGPTKLVHFITKRIFLMLDPFGYSPLRLAPGRDLYQPNLGPHGCLEPGGRPGAGRLNGSNGPTKLVHFITKRIFLMLDPFGYSPLRLAQDGTYTSPIKVPMGARNQEVVLGQAV